MADLTTVDIVSTGLEYLPSRDLSSTVYRELASIILERLQVIDDLCLDMAYDRAISSAAGAQLDGLGDILDEPRGALPDGPYRAFLRAKILVIRSKGRMDELRAILRAVGVTEIDFRLRHPAALQVEFATTPYPAQTCRALRLARAGGVHLIMSWSMTDHDHTYQASSQYAVAEYSDDTGAGAGIYAPAIGGESSGGLI